MNLALLAAAATGVQVGATIVASRYLVAEVPPLTLALLRYAIGFLSLLPFVWRPLRAHRAATCWPWPHWAWASSRCSMWACNTSARHARR